MGEPSAAIRPSLKASAQAQSEHLALNAHSLCDGVTAGITKDAVAKMTQSRDLRLTEKERESDAWAVEEPGFRCSIFFDSAGAVLKKKKTIVTD